MSRNTKSTFVIYRGLEKVRPKNLIEELWAITKQKLRKMDTSTKELPVAGAIKH